MKFQSVKGTKDILPDESYKWQYVEQRVRAVFERFGYREIRTPIFEETALFQRGIGETTDIVGKEMYSFQPDPNSESLTLRPEMTASVVRAYLQHHLGSQAPLVKVYYIAELFRKERPQAGRQRQFWQFGCECLGSPNPEADAEVIALMMMIYRELGIRRTTLRLNSLGNAETRKTYRSVLREYLRPHYNALDEVSKERFEKNPLRILDSKNPDLQELIRQAPRIIDYLDDESRAHFEAVQAFLTDFDIPFVIDPCLVRGLDYYSRTAFELQSEDLGAQDALGGGGRYDMLSVLLGGDAPVPAVGFASGMERLMIAMEKHHLFDSLRPPAPTVMIVAQSDSARQWAIGAAYLFRKEGIATEVDILRRSLKAQLREANRMQAKYAVIAGESELQSGKFQLKNLQTGEQQAL
ncbi:MAG: histidine--tRNA ligase, partial [Chloroherpetonaceae bacterium]|nr:histidine--tRNA ligase [Chloroherpetonaceae bacterium]